MLLVSTIWPALAGARQLRVGPTSDFKTIQSALDSIPPGNRERVVIHISRGIYPEQLRIRNSFITLLGENRNDTRISAAVDTSACPVPSEQSKEEHCSVIVADGTDLVFEDFTVENPIKPGSGKGAALSVVNDSTRIIVHNVDVIGYGGDTFVLSARRDRIGDGGEYYANDVFISGTYHIIVPRGAAYVVDSTFSCLGGEKNCLFAEGITRETDKLVIKDSVIDGPEPFGLGSYFRDAAWYFINDSFGKNLQADGRIHREPAKNYEMKWGEGRVYFAGCKGPSYPWLRDNIQQSPAKRENSVTAQWVFPEWNPESKVGPAIQEIKSSVGEIGLVFDENVTVEGEPLVSLSGGTASYIRGSGTNTLVFRRQGDGSPRRLRLNGGLIYGTKASLYRRDAKVEFPPQH